MFITADSVHVMLKIPFNATSTPENLFAAEYIPFVATPKNKVTIILSETLTIHHDSAFGISGIEYFNIFFSTYLSKYLIFMYWYIFFLNTIYKVHITFPINVAVNIPYAPILKNTIKITFNITVKNPDKKLPIAYVTLSCNPLLVCNKTDENTFATKLTDKKYL